MLAYLILDGPGIPQDQLRVCVFVPTLVITVTWIMIKWKKWLVLPALVIALLGSFIVSMEMLHPITRRSMIEDFGTSYVAAIVLSAAIPFFAIAVFYLKNKKGPNQALETTATAVTDRAAHAPRQP
jgi:hypothetical protein